MRSSSRRSDTVLPTHGLARDMSRRKLLNPFDIFMLPPPDLVILLDLPADEAQNLIAGKEARSYTVRKADLQEADSGYLEKVRQVYLELAARQTNWHVLDCWRDGAMRTIEDVGDEIWNLLDTRRNS